MRYELEIFRDGEWYSLDLPPGQKIKYNVQVNDIGEPTKRRISHSNTYSLPWTRKNIQHLSLNRYNSTSLTKSLNRKLPCRIKVDGRVSLEGFLVINNPNQRDIKVNVIDKSVDLLERWGSMTYREFLNNEDIFNSLTPQFQSAIIQMREYPMPYDDQKVTPLTNVPGRSFPIAHYPNTLNVIGDKFNHDRNGNRVDPDRFNPYQSRPVFSVSTFINIICEAFGYTLGSATVDVFDSFRDDYIVPENYKDEVDVEQYPDTFPISINRWDVYSPNLPDGPVRAQMAFLLPPEAPGTTPNNIDGIWVHPPSLMEEGLSGYFRRDYRNLKCIYEVDENNFSGNLTFFCNYGNNTTNLNDSDLRVRHYIRSLWRYAPTGEIHLFQMELDEDYYEYTTLADRQSVEIRIDKTQLQKKPMNNDWYHFRGILHVVQFRRPISPTPLPTDEFDNPFITNMRVLEEIVDGDKVLYNEYDEYYRGTTVNLANNAPDVTLKNLFSGILVKTGLLTFIEESTKTVYLYNYGNLASIISSQRSFIDDWSNYFLKDMPIEYDTQFGEQYAKVNRVSLKDPFVGNYSDIILTQHGDDSKFKDFAELENTEYKDVSNVQLVNSGGVRPYFEFTNKGLGLVQIGNVITNLIQTSSTGNEAGFINVRHMQNVNYSVVDKGVQDWYDIIDKGVRGSGYFRFPQDVVKNINIRRPKFVSGLRSSLIVEKIEEYINEETPVRVKFIIPGVFQSEEQIT